MNPSGILTSALLLLSFSCRVQAEPTSPVPHAATRSVVSGSLLAQAPNQADPAKLAAEILVEAKSLHWGQTFQEWKKRNPKREYEIFHADGYSHDIDDEWCYQATGSCGILDFYALEEEKPYAARLHRYKSEFENLPPETLRAIYQHLQEGLSKQYGKSYAPLTRFEVRNDFWLEARSWQVKQLELVLFLDYDGSAKGRKKIVNRVGLEMRDGRIAYLHELNTVETPLAINTSNAVPSMDEEILAILKTLYPPAVPMLTSEWKTAKSASAALEQAAKLMRLAVTAKPEMRPVAIMAADMLANKFPLWLNRLEKNPAGEKFNKRLKALGIPLGWLPLGDAWSYDHEVLRRVWKEYPHTRWGEWAFLYLLNCGWRNELDGVFYPDVIREGKAFLSTHPNSPYGYRVKLLVGEAYETWWALSQASPRDGYVRAAEFANGAQEARIQAIRYYEEVLKHPFNEEVTPYILWRLPRLKLGFDTGHRPFFSVYD